MWGDAEGFARAARARVHRHTAGGVLLAALAAAAYALSGVDSLILPLVLLVVLYVPILLWRLPRLNLYVTFAAVCTIELFQTGFKDALTDRIPFFWNVNTIFQVYAHVNFKAIPLNLFECFILTGLVCSLLRAVFTKNVSVRGGPLLVPILLYLVWVVVAWANGKATGGDFKISLQETRAQFYFLFAYLMAYNLVREKKQVNALLWVTAVCLVFKGFLYTFRRYVTIAGQPLPDQGVGSHEEAFLFDAFVMWLLASWLCGTHPKLRGFMLATLPIVILGNLATNRRAATAAIAILIPVLLLAAFQGLPHRRRMALIAAAAVCLGGPVYYQVFKNSQSALAQPARAIRSQFQPDERDASSNLYRDAENANQMATIKRYPLGYGYGKKFLKPVPMADISGAYEWFDILPHNQILWVWMRTGTQGFFFFWTMIAAIVIFAAQTFRDEALPLEMRAVALFGLLVIGLLLVFGLLDLQISNFRDMLFAGFWTGITARLRDFRDPDKATALTTAATKNAKTAKAAGR